MRALILPTALIVTGLAAPAFAQDFEASVYTGWQTAPHSRISGDMPGTGDSFDELIGWEGKSFEMPPYWGIRGTWWQSATFGWALEFTHAKVYANEDDRDDAGFETLEFTDGINILTVNAMQRWPEHWGKLTPFVGAGLGIHRQSEVHIKPGFGETDMMNGHRRGAAIPANTLEAKMLAAH